MLNLLTYIYGNKLGQELLASVVRKCHRYMGIGTGDNVLTSGERGVVERLKQIAPPYCIFDVGSHHGEYLQLVLSALNGIETKIHCFEPGERQFQALTENFASDPRAILNNFGLGGERAQRPLFYDAQESGGSLTKRRLAHIGIELSMSETVTIDTVDDYCERNGIHYIHLLKADIEGHEVELFAGATRMFQTGAVGMTTFEFGGCNIDTKTYFQDYFYLFHGWEMDLYRITPSGYLHPIRRYEEIHEQFRTTNFAAVSRRAPPRI